MTSHRARIELLVRGADGTDFETRRVESSVAYLQLRPQRISAEQWEVAEAPRGMHVGPTYVLKNRLTEEYLLLTEAERFLLERMDGHTSLQEMATAYVLRFGSFDFDLIPALIAKLRQTELLTMRPASRLREVLSRHDRNPAARAAEAVLKAIERLHVASRSAHALFERMYRRGAFLLFSPLSVAVLIVVAILGPSARTPGSKIRVRWYPGTSMTSSPPLMAESQPSRGFFLKPSGRRVGGKSAARPAYSGGR